MSHYETPRLLERIEELKTELTKRYELHEESAEVCANQALTILCQKYRIEELENKLNKDSQNFQIECQKAQIELLQRKYDALADGVKAIACKERFGEMSTDVYYELRALLEETDDE